MSGAAQAVALLVALAAADTSTLDDVRLCPDCESPETKCPACGHVHCDEDGCMSVECAMALVDD